MATVRQLIEDSLVEISVLADGESMGASQGQRALRKLNQLIETWSADGFLVFKTIQESLTVSTSGATIGSGQTLNTEAPIQIESAKISLNNLDYDVELISSQEYAGISSKSQTGRPTRLYYEGRGTGAKIYLWPVPDQSYTLKLFSQKKIASFSDLSETVTLPPGYEALIVSNLAMALCPSYGQEPLGSLVKSAQDSYAACARSSFVAVKMTSDLAPQGQYNINSRDYEA
jgi:hypothetical protein